MRGYILKNLEENIMRLYKLSDYGRIQSKDPVDHVEEVFRMNFNRPDLTEIFADRIITNNPKRILVKQSDTNRFALCTEHLLIRSYNMIDKSTKSSPLKTPKNEPLIKGNSILDNTCVYEFPHGLYSHGRNMSTLPSARVVFMALVKLDEMDVLKYDTLKKIIDAGHFFYKGQLVKVERINNEPLVTHGDKIYSVVPPEDDSHDSESGAYLYSDPHLIYR